MSSEGNGKTSIATSTTTMVDMSRMAGTAAAVVMYGCAPYEPPPNPPGDGFPPPPPWVPMPATTSIPNIITVPIALTPCPKCNRHTRAGEPCPFCLRSDLDALKAALGKDAKPAEAIATLKTALRKALGALRDVSKVTGGALEPLIAECEKALDEEAQ